MKRSVGHDDDALHPRAEEGQHRLQQTGAEGAAESRRVSAALEERSKARDNRRQRIERRENTSAYTAALSDEGGDGSTLGGHELDEGCFVVRQRSRYFTRRARGRARNRRSAPCLIGA